MLCLQVYCSGLVLGGSNPHTLGDILLTACLHTNTLRAYAQGVTSPYSMLVHSKSACIGGGAGCGQHAQTDLHIVYLRAEPKQRHEGRSGFAGRSGAHFLYVPGVAYWKAVVTQVAGWLCDTGISIMLYNGEWWICRSTSLLLVTTTSTRGLVLCSRSRACRLTPTARPEVLYML